MATSARGPALDTRFAGRLRLAAKKAAERGEISWHDSDRIRGVKDKARLTEAQALVLHRAYRMGLIPSERKIPGKIDSEKFIQLLIELLPLILILFEP